MKCNATVAVVGKIMTYETCAISKMFDQDSSLELTIYFPTWECEQQNFPDSDVETRILLKKTIPEIEGYSLQKIYFCKGSLPEEKKQSFLKLWSSATLFVVIICDSISIPLAQMFPEVYKGLPAGITPPCHLSTN